MSNHLKNFEALSREDQAMVMAAVEVLCAEENIAKKITALAEVKNKKPNTWRLALLKLGV